MKKEEQNCQNCLFEYTCKWTPEMWCPDWKPDADESGKEVVTLFVLSDDKLIGWKSVEIRYCKIETENLEQLRKMAFLREIKLTQITISEYKEDLRKHRRK